MNDQRFNNTTATAFCYFPSAASDAGCTMAYREIDPDVFGEELERPAYRDVERIAAIGAVFRRAA